MKYTLFFTLLSLYPIQNSFASPPCGVGGSCAHIGCPAPDTPTCVYGRCTCRTKSKLIKDVISDPVESVDPVDPKVEIKKVK